MSLRTQPLLLGVDLTRKRLHGRLQAIFPEHTLTVVDPTTSERPAVVFVDLVDDESLLAVRRWVRRAPTIALGARQRSDLLAAAVSLGAVDGLILPLEVRKSRLALRHVLSPPKRVSLPTLNLADLERLAIDEALRRTKRSFAEAAQLLGVGRSTLYRRAVPDE